MLGDLPNPPPIASDNISLPSIPWPEITCAPNSPSASNPGSTTNAPVAIAAVFLKVPDNGLYNFGTIIDWIPSTKPIVKPLFKPISLPFSQTSSSCIIWETWSTSVKSYFKLPASNIELVYSFTAFVNACPTPNPRSPPIIAPGIAPSPPAGAPAAAPIPAPPIVVVGIMYLPAPNNWLILPANKAAPISNTLPPDSVNISKASAADLALLYFAKVSEVSKPCFWAVLAAIFLYASANSFSSLISVMPNSSLRSSNPISDVFLPVFQEFMTPSKPSVYSALIFLLSRKL